jgi:cell division protein FtsA
VKGVFCGPLATSRAVLSKRQRELGSLVIDFGSGTTTMAVFEENKALHVKSFPIGASYITTDIALGLKTSIDVAEKLKLSEGSVFSNDVSRKESIHMEEYDPALKGEISKRFLSEIIEARMIEILSLIQNELKLMNKQARLPGGVVVSGGGAHIRGLEDLVRQELKMSVQMGYPDCSKLEVLNPAHRELLEDPNFACAVGLVLSGIDETTKKTGVSMSPETLKNFFKNLMP